MKVHSIPAFTVEQFIAKPPAFFEAFCYSITFKKPFRKLAGVNKKTQSCQEKMKRRSFFEFTRINGKNA
jgi:hypothetical protein